MQPLLIIPYNKQYRCAQNATPTFAVQTPTVTRRVYPQKRPLGAPALRDAPPGGIMCISDALVAQPDRASDYESEGRRFESCRARRRKNCKPGLFPSRLDVHSAEIGDLPQLLP